MAIALAVASALTIAACGSSSGSGSPSAHPGTYTVQVADSFPSHQKLSETTELVVDVTNSSKATLPNVAVTLTNPKHGDDESTEGSLLPPSESAPPLLTDRARPIWTINRAPGPCGRSCQNLGPGPDTASYSRTWALGQLKPGKTIKFDWHVTAVQPGRFTIHYSVAADVAGVEKTLLPNGKPAAGTLDVTISGVPRRPLTRQSTQKSVSG